MKQLQKDLAKHDVSEAAQDKLLAYSGKFEVAVVQRLIKDVERTRLGNLDNADEILDRFKGREKRRRITRIAFRSILIAAITALLGVGLTEAIAQVAAPAGWVLLGLAVLVSTCLGYEFFFVPNVYLCDTKEQLASA